jgi:hypothetical protein
MIRWILIFLTFVSVILFPWPLTAILVLGSSFFIPLLPLAIGIFADTIYYSANVAAFPTFTVLGAAVTGIVFLVRSRLQTSTMRK